MQNLDQIRARNALDATNGETYPAKGGGEVGKKLPTMVRENGIMATLAFVLEKDKQGKFSNDGMKRAMDRVVEHLTNVGKVPKDIKDSPAWQEFLAEKATSAHLREQTDEALAYLGFFRRYASKQENAHAGNRYN